MVAKRQCSFCAQEIEPGTGTMFVKRDGTVLQFCSSSCRKQQLGLGRIGHRLKWTRAYALKKAAERSSAARTPSAARSRTPPTPARAPTAPVAVSPAAAAEGASAAVGSDGATAAPRPSGPTKSSKAPGKPAAQRARKVTKTKPGAAANTKSAPDEA
jgi:large subunit ribosomal protein L24e